MIINNPIKYFEELGNLHDARLELFKWVPDENIVLISLDDINSNFVGLPEYKGCQPVIIKLADVKKINVSVDPTEKYLNIYDFVVESLSDHSLAITITCWPGGSIKIGCTSVVCENSND